jgi:hypothetical protein
MHHLVECLIPVRVLQLRAGRIIDEKIIADGEMVKRVFNGLYRPITFLARATTALLSV